MGRKKWLALLLCLVLALASCGGGSSTEGPASSAPSPETAEPAPEPDPAAALVGTWTNQDGVGLKFTDDGTVKLSGFGLTLGSDTFTYEVTGENTLTLTATVGGLVSADTECPYGILDDILYIEIGDYSFELTKK